MTFYRIDTTAHFGAAPEGATVLNLDDAAPFRGLSISPAALAEVLRLHADRFGTGREANLRGADLREANLRGADLSGADLRGADLREANLRGADLSGADLRGANLREANLRGANLREANLRGADLREANLSEANLSEANLSEANLRGANLREANLSGANLSGANLSEANLREANLSEANLSEANLREANLSETNLSGADLSGANLSGANLSETNLSGADLSGANLSGANLSEADLSGAVGLTSPEEEAANIAAAVEAIAAEPHHWNQAVWHGSGFDPAAAPTVGSCGTAHCLAGWMQALLPIGDERRKLDPESCGWALAPRAASAGWFAPVAHRDLQSRVDTAIAKRNASPA